MLSDQVRRWAHQGNTDRRAAPQSISASFKLPAVLPRVPSLHCRNHRSSQCSLNCRGRDNKRTKGVGAVFGCIRLDYGQWVHPTNSWNLRIDQSSSPSRLADMRSARSRRVGLGVCARRGKVSFPFLPNDSSFNSPKGANSLLHEAFRARMWDWTLPLSDSECSTRWPRTDLGRIAVRPFAIDLEAGKRVTYR